jgi:hypothetical protein
MSDEPAADRQSVTETTGLLWGIKTSFVSYLKGMPDMRSSISGGATVTSRGRFLFPLASSEDYDVSTNRGVLKFTGDLRFSAHFGMLFVAFIDPWVSIDDNGAQLSVADPDSYPDATVRLPMVDLAAPQSHDHGPLRTWQGTNTTLRAEAVAFFNEVYAVGEEFDPLDMRIALAD